MKMPKALTITYLSTISLSSLNGADKVADNISSIKKFSRGTDEYPYGSAQWQEEHCGNNLNYGWRCRKESFKYCKKAATTMQNLTSILMMICSDTWSRKTEGEKGTATKRTSPVRVSPLIHYVNMKD